MARRWWAVPALVGAAVALAACGEDRGWKGSEKWASWGDGTVIIPQPGDPPVGEGNAAEPGTPAPGGPITAADCLALVTAEGRRIHVAADAAPGGDGSEAAPFRSIQAALAGAAPGDTVVLAPGRYAEDVRTVRDGTRAEPIAIVGAPGAVVQGAGAENVIAIDHDHHLLCGFTVDGLHGDRGSAAGYRDGLLRAAGVTGLRLLAMDFRNAGGACVRIAGGSNGNEVAWSAFEACGVRDFVFGGAGRSGEAIAIGTASGAGEPDRSDENHVHDNRFDTGGNECVAIEAPSAGNVIERNRCTGQLDAASGGMASRGSGNLFLDNEIGGNVGAGIVLGGAGEAEGIDNVATGNVIRDNAGGGVKVTRAPQRRVCGNTLAGNAAGDAVGEHAAAYAPGAPCEE